MLKCYPPPIFEILARLNRFTLGWLGGAAARDIIWQTNEGHAAPMPSDAECLATVVASLNLWVGEGTMLRDSPSLTQACADLEAWAAGKPARLDILDTCRELLHAVRDFEVSLKDGA